MPQKKDSENKPAWVLLVCGLPGSGKTTLRQRLVNHGWAYISQDEMQTADACEKALVKALKAGNSCVVDRCNVTPSDRRLWMQHARRAVEKGLVKGVQLHFEAVWMATPVQVCKERAQARAAHETLSPEAASEVIESFCRGLRPPERSGQEPYDAVHVVATQEDADLVTERLKDPASVDVSVCLAPPARALATAAAAEAAAASVSSPAAPADEVGQEQVPDSRALASDAAASAELFILRHGERADRAKGRDGGWADDPPLTQDGRVVAKQAGVALSQLATMPWGPAVYSSPFYRCLQTANEVAAELVLPVRVEPGLSELCCSRIFDQQPQLRSPDEALRAGLTRTEVDLSMAPHCGTVPQWPESGHAAKPRVLGAAQAIAARHPGLAVCLVCHSHSLVELTRHLPKRGGGATASQSGYCALSHIDGSGALRRNLDHTYLRLHAEGRRALNAISEADPASAAGRWIDGWRWQDADEEDGDPVSDLLDLGLEGALAKYTIFANLFSRGAPEKQEAWRQGWAVRDIGVREQLRKALAAGIFDEPLPDGSLAS